MKKLLLIVFAATFVVSCGKKDDDEDTPPTVTPTCADGIMNQSETGIDCGGPCAACPSCSDGIQNQGETGIDCGGPCSACGTNLCAGITSTSYLPLKKTYNWTYNITGASFYVVRRANDSLLFSGNYYYKVTDFVDGGSIENGYFYVRLDASGNLKATYSGAEYTYIPVAPTLNQTWPYPAIFGIGTRKAADLNASIATSACSYTGCLKIQEINPSGSVTKTLYYKKGIGIVYSTDGWTPYSLTAISLN